MFYFEKMRNWFLKHFCCKKCKTTCSNCCCIHTPLGYYHMHPNYPVERKNSDLYPRRTLLDEI